MADHDDGAPGRGIVGADAAEIGAAIGAALDLFQIAGEQPGLAAAGAKAQQRRAGPPSPGECPSSSRPQGDRQNSAFHASLHTLEAYNILIYGNAGPDNAQSVTCDILDARHSGREWRTALSGDCRCHRRRYRRGPAEAGHTAAAAAAAGGSAGDRFHHGDARLCRSGQARAWSRAGWAMAPMSGCARTGFAGAGRAVDISMNLPPRFEDAALNARMQAGIAEVSGEGLDLFLAYQDPGGADWDRAAGAQWLAPRLPGVTADRIAVCPGTQGALVAVAGAAGEARRHGVRGSAGLSGVPGAGGASGHSRCCRWRWTMTGSCRTVSRRPARRIVPRRFTARRPSTIPPLRLLPPGAPHAA